MLQFPYMVNTVGSYETKHWHKNWIDAKRDIFLTAKQRSLIIGSLLGDGTMRMGIKAKNANFKAEQGLEQKEYVFWKYEILKPLVFTKPKLSFRYNEDGERYPKSWWFRTIRHPLLTEIYERFYAKEKYRTGRKIIPQNIIENIDALVFAVWVMDDGSYTDGKIDISTYSFLLSEIQLLQEKIENRFGIKMNYHRDRDKGYRMYCNKKETEKLIKIIQPHIIVSMRYKIGFVTP